MSPLSSAMPAYFDRASVLNLATDRDQARICLNYVRAFFTDIPMLNAMIGRETTSGFELSNAVDIAIATNNFRAVRGRVVLAPILDECAFYQSDNSTSPDVETYRALMPGLATLPGAMLIGISSPYRRAGLLYQKYKDHFGRAGDVLVVKAESKMLNPTLDQSIIDQAIIDDPAGAASEWLGEFRSDLSGGLPAEVIEATVDVGVTVRPPSARLCLVPDSIFRTQAQVPGLRHLKDRYVAPLASKDSDRRKLPT